MMRAAKGYLGLFFAICIVISIALLIKNVSAESWSWTANAPVIDSKDSVDPNSSGLGNYFCGSSVSSVLVVGDGANTRPTDCLVGETEQFKIYTFYDSRTNHSLAIQFTGELYATKILNIGCPSDCTYLPSTGEFIYGVAPAYSIGPVYIYKDFVTHLKLNIGVGQNNRNYEFTKSSPDKVVGGYLTNDGYIKHITRSENDRWLVLDSAAGILRYDMKSGQLIKFSDWRGYYGHSAVIYPVFAISNDGEHVAAMGYNGANQIIDISSSCSVSVPDSPTPEDINARMQNPCPSLSLITQDEANNPYIPYLQHTSMPRFSDDGGELSFYASSSNTTIAPRFIRLHAAGYTIRQLDYLALGDSYSSGEGDTEKDSSGNKYYRELTDTQSERCHLSTRSYPYLLAKSMNLTFNTQWNSVACSGATAWDIKAQGSSDYLGQNDRLKGLGAATLKEQALNEFIPGRQKQIEFVKKYHPKVITLTMGGNDIGFGDKIHDCVANPTTCNIATTARGSLKNEILSQYVNLKSFYQELYIASGSQAKIYVLGYPNFINDYDSAICYANVGALNTDERVMIKNSVTFINNVIKQAAKSAGVKYIDIEDSLIGHRLCDNGDKHVTGIADPSDATHNRQESFHPNAAGHNDMDVNIKQKIGNVNLKDYDICPESNENSCPDSNANKEAIEIPQYFKDVETINAHYQKMTQFDQAVSNSMDISAGVFSFADSAVVTVVLHSDPITLGQFNAAPDGSLNASVKLPSNVPVGTHTLIVSGQSRSGESIEYEQTVLVKGADPKDADSDGIPDAQDRCLFVTASNKDQDADGIDDGCDPDISMVTSTQSPSPTPSSSPSPTPSPSTPNPVATIARKVIAAVIAIIKTIISVISNLLLR